MILTRCVADKLAAHVAASLKENPLRAIFGAVYQRMAVSVQEFIESDACQAPDLVRELDINFANYYLSACTAPVPPPPPWMQAFHAEKGDYTLTQHLLLGMNAHILYDLPLALEATAQSRYGLNELQADYLKITDILEELVPKVQETVGKYSKLIGCTHYLAQGVDSSIFLKLIVKARAKAWDIAHSLVGAGSMEERETLCFRMSFMATQSAAYIADPGGELACPFKMLVNGLLWGMRQSERNVSIASLVNDLMCC